MSAAKKLPFRLAAVAVALALAAACQAEAIRTEDISEQAAAAGTVLASEITGDQSIDYVLAADAGQILSVDLSASNASLYFNILPRGAPEALFIGSTSGNVADIPVPEAGTYVIQVYLMRNASRRNQTAEFTLGVGIVGAAFADSLAGEPDWWSVSGLTDGALNIRSGPDTRYAVVSLVQNGQLMQNLGCRMTGTARWCNVRVDGSGVQGWVAGQYLVEAAAPTLPGMPAGGPVGNGGPFDSTGYVDCAAGPEDAMRLCPFGVVRDGPGNAGVWIALGDGDERHILFEGGSPVATNTDAALSFSKSGDAYLISIGSERYSFPDALVMGG